jgi:hypothetical protein
MTSPVEYRLYKDDDGSSPLPGLAGDVALTPRADLALVMALIDTELSEPYSIFTYRYFIDSWPSMCYLVRSGGSASEGPC